MNIRSFNYPNFLNFFGNIESEKIGFYFSFGLHLVFLIFVIGFPNIFQSSPINIPTVIPIEIINITEITSIPKEIKENIKQEKIKKEKINEKPEQKKFNNALPELKSRVNKIKSETDSKKINVKEKKTVEQDTKVINKIDENIKNIEEEKFESLPTKKIKPKLKPQLQKSNNLSQDIDIKIKSKPSFDSSISLDTDIKVQIKSRPKPSFDIASMLKDLRNDQSLVNKETVKKESIKDSVIKKNENIELKAQLSISEIDLLIQQLSSCWAAPAGAVIKKGMVVKISAKIKPDRMVFYESVRIIDTNIPQSNPFYGPITESAMRTLLNPECNPLKLPTAKYDLWKNLTIIFDHSIMKGYQ